jgi:succinate-semialdehyde dehydrogenase/glutarate-semialdehyde dehydrogenase
MGKPITLARMEVDFAVTISKYYADNLVSFLSHEEIVDNGIKKGVRYDPLGIVLCVKPFNFPLLVPFMGIPSILAGGNKVILKPTECCPTTALIVAEIAK